MVTFLRGANLDTRKALAGNGRLYVLSAFEAVDVRWIKQCAFISQKAIDKIGALG